LSFSSSALPPPPSPPFVPNPLPPSPILLPPSPTFPALSHPLPPPLPSPSLPHAHCTPQTKKQYEKASEEAENAQHALEKADNDPNSTKAKMDKVTSLILSLPPFSSLTYDSPPPPILSFSSLNANGLPFHLTSVNRDATKQGDNSRGVPQ